MALLGWKDASFYTYCMAPCSALIVDASVVAYFNTLPIYQVWQAVAPDDRCWSWMVSEFLTAECVHLCEWSLHYTFYTWRSQRPAPASISLKSWNRYLCEWSFQYTFTWQIEVGGGCWWWACSGQRAVGSCASGRFIILFIPSTDFHKPPSSKLKGSQRGVISSALAI